MNENRKTLFQTSVPELLESTDLRHWFVWLLVSPFWLLGVWLVVALTLVITGVWAVGAFVVGAFWIDRPVPEGDAP